MTVLGYAALAFAVALLLFIALTVVFVVVPLMIYSSVLCWQMFISEIRDLWNGKKSPPAATITSWWVWWPPPKKRKRKK